MNTATNDRLIVQASRSDATGYLEQGHAAMRRLEAAYVKNVAITEGEMNGRRHALHDAISALEERMTVGTAVEIEAAIRVLNGRIESVDEFLTVKAAEFAKVN